MKDLNQLSCEMSAVAFVIVNLKKKLNWVLNSREKAETRQKLQAKQFELKKIHEEFNLKVNDLLCQKKKD